MKSKKRKKFKGWAWIAFSNGKPYGGFWRSRKAIEGNGWIGKNARHYEIREI